MTYIEIQIILLGSENEDYLIVGRPTAIYDIQAVSPIVNNGVVYSTPYNFLQKHY